MTSSQVEFQLRLASIVPADWNRDQEPPVWKQGKALLYAQAGRLTKTTARLRAGAVENPFGHSEVAIGLPFSPGTRSRDDPWE